MLQKKSKIAEILRIFRFQFFLKFFEKILVEEKKFIGAVKVIVFKANHIISANFLFSINQKSDKMSFYDFQISESKNTNNMEFKI